MQSPPYVNTHNVGIYKDFMNTFQYLFCLLVVSSFSTVFSAAEAPKDSIPAPIFSSSENHHTVIMRFSPEGEDKLFMLKKDETLHSVTKKILQTIPAPIVLLAWDIPSQDFDARKAVDNAKKLHVTEDWIKKIFLKISATLQILQKEAVELTLPAQHHDCSDQSMITHLKNAHLFLQGRKPLLLFNRQFKRGTFSKHHCSDVLFLSQKTSSSKRKERTSDPLNEGACSRRNVPVGAPTAEAVLGIDTVRFKKFAESAKTKKITAEQLQKKAAELRAQATQSLAQVALATDAATITSLYAAAAENYRAAADAAKKACTLFQLAKADRAYGIQTAQTDSEAAFLEKQAKTCKEENAQYAKQSDAARRARAGAETEALAQTYKACGDELARNAGISVVVDGSYTDSLNNMSVQVLHAKDAQNNYELAKEKYIQAAQKYTCAAELLATGTHEEKMYIQKATEATDKAEELSDKKTSLESFIAKIKVKKQDINRRYNEDIRASVEEVKNYAKTLEERLETALGEAFGEAAEKTADATQAEQFFASYQGADLQQVEEAAAEVYRAAGQASNELEKLYAQLEEAYKSAREKCIKVGGIFLNQNAQDLSRAAYADAEKANLKTQYFTNIKKQVKQVKERQLQRSKELRKSALEKAKTNVRQSKGVEEMNKVIAKAREKRKTLSTVRH